MNVYRAKVKELVANMKTDEEVVKREKSDTLTAVWALGLMMSDRSCTASEEVQLRRIANYCKDDDILRHARARSMDESGEESVEVSNPPPHVGGRRGNNVAFTAVVARARASHRHISSLIQPIDESSASSPMRPPKTRSSEITQEMATNDISPRRVDDDFHRGLGDIGDLEMLDTDAGMAGIGRSLSMRTRSFDRVSFTTSTTHDTHEIPPTLPPSVLILNTSLNQSLDSVLSASSIGSSRLRKRKLVVEGGSKRPLRYESTATPLFSL
jgi:hypothetical protein